MLFFMKPFTAKDFSHTAHPSERPFIKDRLFSATVGLFIGSTDKSKEI